MKPISVSFVVLTLIVVILSITTVSPPPVVKNDAPDSVFSAQRAYDHLQHIARAPHSIGTDEHGRVREYILHTLRQLGLSPQLQQTTVADRYESSVYAAKVTNIIATIRGKAPGKSVLIAAHYDSQPNTPGAGDDGMGVASILETVRAIGSMPGLLNDVIILISDGEEEGLFGAKAFVEEYPGLKNIGVVINWDFRGNAGVVVTYETSADNGWLIRQYAKGAKHPYASSMAYEVSRRIPNDADFTPFKKAGITGFANGALGGFVNYHSMTDSPEHIDLRTVQLTGDNMLGLLKQFGNASLVNTKAPDLSYFNVVGSWFVYYPADWNFVMSALASLLMAIALILGARQKKISLPGLLISFIGLPLTCVAANFACAYLLKLILKLYPLYSHFYENNSYNSHWYFLSMTLLSLLIFVLAYRPIYRKWGYTSTFGGLLFSLIILMWLSWKFVPSASFLLAIPCLFLSAGYMLVQLFPDRFPSQSLGYNIIHFVSLLPGLFIFSPLCQILFVTFALGNSMPFVGIMIVLTAAILYPVLHLVFQTRSGKVISLITAALAAALITGHLTSGFSSKHPLHTNVRYRLNTDNARADWLSDYMATDKFSLPFFPDKKTDTSFRAFDRLIHPAPVLPYPAPDYIIISDTIHQNKRELTLMCKPFRSGVNTMGIVFDENNTISFIALNGKEVRNDEQNIAGLPARHITIYGIGQEGFEIKLAMKAGSKTGMVLYDQSMGLPFIKNLTSYPDDIIPGTDFNCNTVTVTKHYSF